MTDPVAIARALAAGFATRAELYDREASFPVADLEELRDTGLLGLLVPQRLGGFGAGPCTYAEVAHELAQGNGATALVFNMHASVTGALAAADDELVRALGADEAALEQRDEILAAAGRGAFYQVAMSEPGVGARFWAMTTTYEPASPGWRIRGRKTFCSGAGFADAYLVVARSCDGERVSQFLVPAGAGLDVEDTWDPLGMRATASNDLILDVEVGAGALLGGIEGLTPLLAELLPHWLVSSYAPVYVGVARAALREAAAQLGHRGLGSLGAIRARLGRADAAVEAAWLAAREAAHRAEVDPGSPETGAWVHRAKLLAGDTAMDVATSMVEACGASATRRGNPLERLLRDARCGALHPATSDVCADWLGAAALGLDPHRDAAVPRW